METSTLWSYMIPFSMAIVLPSQITIQTPTYLSVVTTAARGVAPITKCVFHTNSCHETLSHQGKPFQRCRLDTNSMVLFNRTGMVYLTSLVKRFVNPAGLRHFRPSNQLLVILLYHLGKIFPVYTTDRLPVPTLSASVQCNTVLVIREVR